MTEKNEEPKKAIDDRSQSLHYPSLSLTMTRTASDQSCTLESIAVETSAPTTAQARNMMAWLLREAHKLQRVRTKKPKQS